MFSWKARNYFLWNGCPSWLLWSSMNDGASIMKQYYTLIRFGKNGMKNYLLHCLFGGKICHYLMWTKIPNVWLAKRYWNSWGCESKLIDIHGMRGSCQWEREMVNVFTSIYKMCGKEAALSWTSSLLPLSSFRVKLELGEDFTQILHWNTFGGMDLVILLRPY